VLVTVLLPSRGRFASLERSINSLLNTAADDREVEIIVGYDADDPVTGEWAYECGAQTLRFEQRHGYHQLHLYFNMLAETATGDWLLLWNDDATMTTPRWDAVLAGFDERQPLVLSLSSTGYGHALCCFPAVSVSLYKRLGHLSLSPHVDTWLQDIGRATGTIRDIPVHVHHDRHDLTGGHDDRTRAESVAGYRSEEFYGEEMQALLRADIEKVRA
jgi:hypothetical protein